MGSGVGRPTFPLGGPDTQSYLIRHLPRRTRARKAHSGTNVHPAGIRLTEHIKSVGSSTSRGRPWRGPLDTRTSDTSGIVKALSGVPRDGPVRPRRPTSTTIHQQDASQDLASIERNHRGPQIGADIVDA